MDNKSKILVYVRCYSQLIYPYPILPSSINWTRGKSRRCLYVSFSDPGMQSTHFLEKGRDERTHEHSNLF